MADANTMRVMTAIEESLERTRCYRAWARSPEGLALRAPADYAFMQKYPANFKKARDAFHVQWITYKMTR